MARKRKIPNSGDRQDLMEEELAGTEDLGDRELELGEERPRRRRPAPPPRHGEAGK